MNSQKGAAPILILVAIIGVVAFLAVSSSAPFRDNLLSSIFPKEHSHAAPGDELPCTLPNNYPGVCTGFNNYPNNTPFMSVPELVSEWDVRLGQVDASKPGRPVVMHKCGKNDGFTLVEDPDEQINLCAHHLMDNMFETGNLGAITYRARNPVDMNDGYATFTADLNVTGRQTIHMVISDSVVRYPAKPSWGDGGEQHDPVGNGFSINFGPGEGGPVLDITEYHQALGLSDRGQRYWGVACAGVDDKRCKVEVRFDKTGVQVTIAGEVKQRMAFQTPMQFDFGSLSLVRQQYNPTKDCQDGASPTDCPGFRDIFVNGPWPDGQVNVNASDVMPGSLYPGTLYMGYDTTHWDNLGFKSSQAKSRVVAGTPQKTIYFIDSPHRNPSSGYQSTKVVINHPTGGANGRLVFSANGWDAQFSQVRVNGGAWQNLPDTGGAWRTKVVDNINILQGNNEVEFRSIRTQSICCPPQSGWGFNVHRIDLEAITNGPVPTSTPSPSQTPSTTPAPSIKPGDIDGNNKVDIFDYNILLTNFGQTDPNNPADLDKNGRVDIFDYNLLLTNFGK